MNSWSEHEYSKTRFNIIEKKLDKIQKNIKSKNILGKNFSNII